MSQQYQNISSSNTASNQKIVGNIIRNESVSSIIKLNDDEKKRVAIFEAAHVYSAFLLNVFVKKVTLIPSGQFLGHTLLDHGQKTIWDNEYKEKIMTILLAGRASEVHFLQSPSTLTEDNFKKLKEIANSLTICSEKKAREEEIKTTCNRCNEQATNLIKNNSNAIEKCAQEYLSRRPSSINDEI
uniref:Peptidase_M41 domain-containing protein n=1 Tax=Meloidogyne hapla TaxID=6305 RepID=A0A1I8BLR9_MELHA